MPRSLPRRHVLRQGLAAAAVLAAPTLTRAAPDRWRTLDASLSALSATVDGRLGVCVRDLGDGGTSSLHGRERFVMHSTVKMIVCASIAERIARGEIGLKQSVRVPAEGRPGGQGAIDKALAAHGDGRFSVLALMEAAMLDSDNAGCDAMFSLLGGPQAVDADLRRWGIAGIRVGRTMAQTYLPFRDTVRAKAVYDALLKDPGNDATPDGYAEFTVRLVNGSLIAPAATTLVTDLFARSRLGPGRVTAGLGPGWTVSSRTGGGPTVNGRCSGTHQTVYATTSTGRRLVVSAFLGDAAGDSARRDAVLAEVGRRVRAAWQTA